MNALTAIKALIMKSRPAYKDYLGKATKLVKIYEGAFPEDGSDGIEANCLDPNFEGFVTGEYYDVVIDGEQKKCLGFLVNGAGFIGCADSLEEINQLMSEENPNVWYAATPINGKILLFSFGSFSNKSITISKTVSEEKYDIKKLPEECLPDSVGKKINTVSTAITKLQSLVNDTESMANEALGTAQDAQHNISTTNSIANTAKSTAETAKSTAETAKSTAETAKSTAETANTTAESAWNMARTVQDQNVYLASKILDRYFEDNVRITEALTITFPTSEFQYPLDCTMLFKNKYPMIGYDYTFTWEDGTSSTVTCVNNTLSFYKQRPSNVLTTIYYSPSSHQYCFKGKKGTLTGTFCSKIEVDLLPYISFSSIILASSNSSSSKKFKITVDDTGKLTATEVTT